MTSFQKFRKMSEKKSFLSQIFIENWNKTVLIRKKVRFLGHQSYALLCSKITSFPPSEGEFSEKLGIFSKVKIFQNPSCFKLEKINENYDTVFFGYHDLLKIYGTPKLCTVM